MTDEAATDTAAANATPAPEGSTPAPEGTQNSGSEEGQGDGARAPLSEGGEGGGEAPEFSLPDEYKDKPWADKIKSPEDAYKQIDNLTALVGKKTIQPIDYETASAEEIAEHHAKLAPENGAEGYAWAEHSMPELTDPMGEIFVKAGINAHQQKVIAEGFDEAIEKIAGEKVAADTSEEGYLAIMKESFGDDYEKSVGVVETALKEFASDDDKKFFDEVDNNTRAAVDRTTHSIVKFYEDKISSLLKEHGITESGAQTSGGEGKTQTKSKAERRAEIRKEMREVDGKPDGYKRKAELQAELNKLL